MIPIQLHGLSLVIAAELAIIFVCSIFVLWHAASSTLASRRAGAQLTRAHQIVSMFLESQFISHSNQRWLKSLGTRRRIDLFSKFAGLFDGEELARLHELAQLTGLTESAERRCRSRMWSRRLEGVRLFTIIGGGQEYVLPLFHDRYEEVRAGAAEWAANHPDEEVIKQLLPLLSDDSGFCRFVVKDSFVRLGHHASSALLEYLESNTDPHDDALEVATWISDPRLLPAAIRLQSHPSPQTRALALALLASIGGPEALSAATKAIRDEDAHVRIAALKALARIGHWSVTSAVAAALRDPEWNVRHEAATTLHALGAPGVLMLRRTLRDSDSFAADMSRHILDVSKALTA